MQMTKNPQIIGVRILNFRFGDFTIYVSCNFIYLFFSCSCATTKIPMKKNVKTSQILENIVITYKYNTCTTHYFLCLEVCYLLLFIFRIVFPYSCSMSVCISIPIIAPTPFIFLCIIFFFLMCT